jgi:hypothetical protein
MFFGEMSFGWGAAQWWCLPSMCKVPDLIVSTRNNNKKG